MVERFHSTMKAALMCHQPATWNTTIILLLLGLRNIVKRDLQIYPAELLYGEQLRVMSEFFSPSAAPQNPDTLILQLYEDIATVCPVSEFRHFARTIFMCKDLKDATHVFLRTDSLTSSLQPPYTGPNQVISGTEKTYKLRTNNI
jgi:hypothetical protein